jgi:hypothetical protein
MVAAGNRRGIRTTRAIAPSTIAARTRRRSSWVNDIVTSKYLPTYRARTLVLYLDDALL